MKKRPTQKQMVLKHLQSGKPITSIDAIHRYGITRLAAIIGFLKNDGHKIAATYKTQKKNKGAPFAVYRLLK